MVGDETQEVLQKVKFVAETAETIPGYNARSMSGGYYWVVGQEMVTVREVGHVEYPMTAFQAIDDYLTRRESNA